MKKDPLPKPLRMLPTKREKSHKREMLGFLLGEQIVDLLFVAKGTEVTVTPCLSNVMTVKILY